MYCVKCGVKLEDTEKVCPLCGTVPYHPEIKQGSTPSLYPQNKYPRREVRPFATLIALSALLLLANLSTLLCDLHLSGGITWSGFVITSTASAYAAFLLPFWFKNPNPVIFVPCGFVAAGLLVLYIDLATGGGWFLSFAFPVIGGIALIVTAIVTLMRYVKRGGLYIYGGATIALGAMMPLTELLLNITFRLERFVFWSFYPLGVLLLIGLFLIFLAICRPAREAMERKFFV